MRAYLIVVILFALFVLYHVVLKEDSVVNKINNQMEELHSNLPN
jgi:hypothetical protein